MPEILQTIKDFAENAAKILTAPISNILCVSGVALILAAFIDHDGISGWNTHPNPITARLLIGVGLLGGGILIYFISQKDVIGRTRLDFKKGVSITRGELTISIKESEMEQLLNTNPDTAIVLPANTVFSEDCFTDARTAIGAFFTKHFSNQLQDLRPACLAALNLSGIRPDAEGQYAPATTLLLSDQYARPAKILIAVSSTKTIAGNISSNPHIICGCVENIFRLTGNQQIDTIYVPLLGSGHGGLQKDLALLFLVYSILWASKYYHHIKSVNICVHPNDLKKLDGSKELRMIAAL